MEKVILSDCSVVKVGAFDELESFGISFDRDGCEWFESPIWGPMDDENEESLYRRQLVDEQRSTGEE